MPSRHAWPAPSPCELSLHPPELRLGIVRSLVITGGNSLLTRGFVCNTIQLRPGRAAGGH